jgi:arabinogalactan endo-1,4-beta-galactosidase
MKRIPTSILASLLLLVFSGYGVTNAFAVPSGTYVTIRANTLSEVVTVSSSGYLTANALSWDGSTNEEFIEVTNSNSTVSFYSVSAGKYVSASSTSTQLIANSATIGTAQEFKIQSSTYTGWANAGDDEVIYSVNLATDWTINSSTDGSIYAKTLDQAGQYQNFSVMPIPILPTSSSLNKPAPGADISEGLGAQNKGVVFENTSGVSGDYLAILKAAGVTWIRCRINVNPTTATNNYGILQTTTYVTSVMKAAKADGFKLLLDFHYSDTWADPSAQTTPAAWSTTSLTTLESQLSSYTTSVLTTLNSNSAWPDMIQIGNEVDSGMLWPLGNAWVNSAWNSNYPVLYNTAYSAISSTSTSLGKTMPKIMLHISSSGNMGTTRYFLDDAVAAGMKFDVIGLSYYEMWDGVVANMKATIDEIYYRYPTKSIAIAETAYYYTPNVITPTDPLTYATTSAGQQAFLTALLTQTELNPKLGYVFYWGTCWSEPSKWYEPWPDSSNTAQDSANRALFDSNGKLLPAVSVLTAY